MHNLIAEMLQDQLHSQFTIASKENSINNSKQASNLNSSSRLLVGYKGIGYLLDYFFTNMNKCQHNIWWNGVINLMEEANICLSHFIFVHGYVNAPPRKFFIFFFSTSFWIFVRKYSWERKSSNICVTI